ncbi:hypothetical protein BCR34DRAFT_203920 [Clohesyomyces aquaticus]|uniref:Uncharacterized protein n=1 Tax=Clohesyomyces aquaticus TaxID=1231657 RepID=A0A1Y1YAM9_9PLEO|nr:hypothetical protein BCR34DRAFT_203920 [Clohesyomyces aquaticus]
MYKQQQTYLSPRKQNPRGILPAPEPPPPFILYSNSKPDPLGLAITWLPWTSDPGVESSPSPLYLSSKSPTPSNPKEQLSTSTLWPTHSVCVCVLHGIINRIPLVSPNHQNLKSSPSIQPSRFLHQLPIVHQINKTCSIPFIRSCPTHPTGQSPPSGPRRRTPSP